MKPINENPIMDVSKFVAWLEQYNLINYWNVYLVPENTAILRWNIRLNEHAHVKLDENNNLDFMDLDISFHAYNPEAQQWSIQFELEHTYCDNYDKFAVNKTHTIYRSFEEVQYEEFKFFINNGMAFSFRGYTENLNY